MVDYNTNGTHYTEGMLVGPNNDYGVVFAPDGTLLIVADPFGASPVVAIKFTTAGQIIMANLPTSDPTVAGQLYVSSGTVKVSAGA